MRILKLYSLIPQSKGVRGIRGQSQGFGAQVHDEMAHLAAIEQRAQYGPRSAKGMACSGGSFCWLQLQLQNVRSGAEIRNDQSSGQRFSERLASAPAMAASCLASLRTLNSHLHGGSLYLLILDLTLIDAEPCGSTSQGHPIGLNSLLMVHVKDWSVASVRRQITELRVPRAMSSRIAERGLAWARQAVHCASTVERSGGNATCKVEWLDARTSD